MRPAEGLEACEQLRQLGVGAGWRVSDDAGAPLRKMGRARKRRAKPTGSGREGVRWKKEQGVTRRASSLCGKGGWWQEWEFVVEEMERDVVADGMVW